MHARGILAQCYKTYNYHNGLLLISNLLFDVILQI